MGKMLSRPTLKKGWSKYPVNVKYLRLHTQRKVDTCPRGNISGTINASSPWSSETQQNLWAINPVEATIHSFPFSWQQNLNKTSWLLCQDCRITECFGLEGTLKIICFQPCCQGQGNLPLEQTQGCINLAWNSSRDGASTTSASAP